MAQSRNWVFTRQLTTGEVADLEKMPHGGVSTAAAAPQLLGELFSWHTVPSVKYLVYQIEKAPTTGKLHCQGLICFKSGRKMNFVKKTLGNDPHVEICKALGKAIEYCKKEESRILGPWEHGDAPKEKGEKKGMSELYEDIKTGKRASVMLEEDPCIARHDRAIKFMKFIVSESTSDRQFTGVTVYVFWGATGLGKTFAAVNTMCTDSDYYILEPPSDGQPLWFDGYEGQKILIMDDFSSKFCNAEMLKRLLDKYKMKVPIKGGFAWANWNKVIITSNYAPRHWYYQGQGQVAFDPAPLKRRIHEIRHFVDMGTYFVQDFEENNFGDAIDIKVNPTTQSSPMPYTQAFPHGFPDVPPLDLYPDTTIQPPTPLPIVSPSTHHPIPPTTSDELWGELMGQGLIDLQLMDQIDVTNDELI